MSRSVLAFLAIVWTCPAGGGEQPGGLCHLSFDRQTVTADFAAGEGRAPSIANPPGWTFAPGVRGLGVVMQPDQRCTFPLAKNYWRNKEWGDPQEQTVCDEVRIFDRVLTDDEILDLYAADSPDSVPRAAPTLVVELLPSYSAKSLAIQVRPAHLDAVWKERVATGATLAVGVRDPRSGVCFSYSGSSERQQFTAQLPDWYDGAYVADAQLSVHGQSLQGQATLTKPPTPWLPAQQDRRAPRVLPPWTPLTRRDGPKHGHMIHYWNGEVTLADPFPTQLIVRGQPLLAGPIRLVASPAATWDEGRVTEQQPQRITLSGAGRLGDLSATFSTLMEFAFNDGWCPGEQYSSAVVGKPSFYMDEIPDRVWRTEFYSAITGVGTFLLPEIGRLGDELRLQERGPSESCLAAALAYGVPVWVGGINPRVVEEVWDAQQAFGMRDAEFVPFWQQRDVSCSDAELRVSLWRKKGGHWLLAVTNFTDHERTAELRMRMPDGHVQFRPAWQADRLTVSEDSARLTIPAKRGSLVIVERRPAP